MKIPAAFEAAKAQTMTPAQRYHAKYPIVKIGRGSYISSPSSKEHDQDGKFYRQAGRYKPRFGPLDLSGPHIELTQQRSEQRNKHCDEQSAPSGGA